MEEMQGDAKTWKAVYTIIDKEGGGKAIWLRIGTAWVNRDQSLNVKLDASPTNGKLHIRDADPERFANRRDGNGWSGAARNDNARGPANGHGNSDGNGADDPFGSFAGGRRSAGNGGA